MNRAILGATGVMACLAVAACGSAPSAAATNRPSASPGARRGFAGNATFGQLVQINGTTLILSGTNGNSTVTYATTTTITQTDTETVADITAGNCITAIGSKGADGTLHGNHRDTQRAEERLLCSDGIRWWRLRRWWRDRQPPAELLAATELLATPAGDAGFTATRGR